MINKINAVLTGTQNSVLYSMKSLQRIVDKVQLALASGKDVNSALDNPQNFFLSKSLSNQARDLNGLLDGIKINLRAIQEANDGIEAIINILDQIDSLSQKASEEIFSGDSTSPVSSFSSGEITAILNANPGVTYSSDTKSFYRVITTATDWNTANANAQNTKLVEPASLAYITGVGGHLVTITSQIENDFVNALSPVNTWIGGTDRDVDGDWRWVGGPEDGQQFWQGFGTGSPVNGAYTNWGAGEPNNFASSENYAHLRPDGFWNDIPGTAPYHSIIEWETSSFLSLKPDLQERAAEYAAQYDELLNQINLLAKDANYQGIGLLETDDLQTFFNVNRTSFLITEGIDATALGLGLVSNNFLTLTTINEAIENARSAKNILRSYTKSLQIDFSIITTRFDFTTETINIHKDAAEDLVITDQNEKSAELLALQTRQQLQVQILRLSNSSSVNSLFT